MELLKLKESTSPGPDKIPEKILKEFAGELAKPPSMLLHTSFDAGYLPPDLKSSRITPLYKGGSQVFANNLGPVSFTSTYYEIMEKIIKRTPGGAKEFIVPSQIRGRFYSLPQSPQQFKQLLMIGCFDRYMQIARCFRDELARPDRQPEFTQLDIEASFVEKDDIYRIVESTLSYAWSALQEFQLDSSPLAIPFQRMSYDEAMRRFGTDKPDTRFGLELWDTENNGTCPHMVCLTVPSLYVDEISQSFMERMRQEVKEKTGQEVSVLHPKDLSPTSAHLRDCLALAKDELLLFVEGDSPLERKTIGLPIYKPGFSFLWVENFPLFSRNADGNLESEHHPFTAPVDSEVQLLYSSPEKEDVDQLRHLLEALSSGAPPHGGIALGIDRLIAIFTRAGSVRDVIAFPKTSGGRDLLSDSPNRISEEELDRYFISIKSNCDHGPGGNR
ncbi:aspartyl-tRNA synthetase 2, mitochondrial [Sparganum proliferum]